MGLEATCVGRFHKQISEGKAHLDSDHLLFRGEFRLKIPFKNMESVSADDGRLVINFPEGKATFELASAAVKWADKILHPPQRIDKLGVKPGWCVAIVGIHDEDFQEEVKARGADIVMKAKKAPDLLFLAADEKADLKRLASFVKVLRPAGAVWVVYPKGVDQIKENDVLAAGRAAGFIDTKVASFSATHTALKFMIPVAQRGAHRKS